MDDPKGVRRDVLRTTLQLAIPLWMERVQGWEESHRLARAAACAQVVAEKGDVLQFGGKGCREAFNALAEGLACAAFQPGGVEFLGDRWEGKRG